MEKFCTTSAQSFSANVRGVCGFATLASAGALLQESAQLVAWTGALQGAEKEPPSGLKAEPLPFLAVPSEEKPVLRRGQLKINSSATA